MEGVNFGGIEEEAVLDMKRKCFRCLSPLNEHCRLQNLQKLFATLKFNYEEIIKKAGGVQLERMILDGVVSRFKVKLCNSCGGSLEEFSKAEESLMEAKSKRDKLFPDLLAVDKSNTIQTTQIAQLYSSACEEVGWRENHFSKFRERFCKDIVKAFENEETRENLKKEKPSSTFGYFVEPFVLNLRLELNEKCKADLKSQSTKDQVGPVRPSGCSTHSPVSVGAPSKSGKEGPSVLASTASASVHAKQRPSFSSLSSSSSSGPPSLQTIEPIPIRSDSSGKSSPPMLHPQSNFPSTSSVSPANKPKRARLTATGINGAPNTKDVPEELNGASKTMPSRANNARNKLFDSGFKFKCQDHFDIHDDTHYTCRYCQAELKSAPSGKSVRGKARYHYFGRHYKAIDLSKNVQTQNKKSSSSRDNGAQGGTVLQKNSTRGLPEERFKFVIKASDHFNFQGKTFCACKYCPQTYSGTYCGQAARCHVLGRNHLDKCKKMNQGTSNAPTSSSEDDSAIPQGPSPEQATTISASLVKISEGRAATVDGMNVEDVPQDGFIPEVDSAFYSQLSIAEVDTSTLTTQERQDISSF